MVDACENMACAYMVGEENIQRVCVIGLWWNSLPGDIVVLTDSHSPTSGVLNFLLWSGLHGDDLCIANRINSRHGSQDGACGSHRAPEGGLSPKDLILHIIGIHTSVKNIGEAPQPTPVLFSLVEKHLITGMWTSYRFLPT